MRSRRGRLGPRLTSAPPPWKLHDTGLTVQDYQFRDVVYPLVTWTCQHCGYHDPQEVGSELARSAARGHYLREHLPAGTETTPWG